MLRKRVRDLESALGDAHLDLRLEKSFLSLACEAAGIDDVEEFKKKVDMTRYTGFPCRRTGKKPVSALCAGGSE
jgi:hypothetical protein